MQLYVELKNEGAIVIHIDLILFIIVCCPKPFFVTLSSIIIT